MNRIFLSAKNPFPRRHFGMSQREKLQSLWINLSVMFLIKLLIV